jgi:glycosyltransferase involved in cell wall biosynthesis
VDDRALAAALGDAGRQRAESQSSIESCAAAYESEYARLLAS